MKTKRFKIIGFFLTGILVSLLFFVVFSTFPTKLDGEALNLTETSKVEGPAVFANFFEVVPSLISSSLVTKNSEEGKDNLNILLLGSDARSVDTVGRSDTIILVGINFKTKKINMMSFPRDLRVLVPGHANYGHVKLNSTFNEDYFRDGGPKLVVKTIETLVTGLKIDGYLKINFEGFIKFVDAIGGIDYTVEEKMNCFYGGKEIVLKPGKQHLNGVKALLYMRFRYDGIGDFAFNLATKTIIKADGTKSTVVVETEAGRAARQKKLIVAIVEQTKSIRNIVKIAAVIKAIKQTYSSNFNALYLTSLILKLKDVGGKNVTVLPFPASKVGSIWENGRSISYVFPPTSQQAYRDKILKYFPR